MKWLYNSQWNLKVTFFLEEKWTLVQVSLWKDSRDSSDESVWSGCFSNDTLDLVADELWSVLSFTSDELGEAWGQLILMSEPCSSRKRLRWSVWSWSSELWCLRGDSRRVGSRLWWRWGWSRLLLPARKRERKKESSYTGWADVCEKNKLHETSECMFAFLRTHKSREKKKSQISLVFSCVQWNIFSCSATIVLVSGYNLTRQTFRVQGEQFTSRWDGVRSTQSIDWWQRCSGFMQIVTDCAFISRWTV